MPKVSVVLPTYNRENTIENAIRSVLDQTFEDLELIVVDDGSQDKTKDIITKIDDPRMKCIFLEENGGVCNARNVGIKEAMGEWIAFEDSDDIWAENKLEIQLKYAEDNSEYEAVYCSYEIQKSNGEISIIPTPENDVEELQGDIYPHLLVQNEIGAPTLIVKRSLLKEVGYFNPLYLANEDWELVLRIAKGHKIGFVRDALVTVNMLEGGVSSNVPKYFDARCRMIASYYNDLVATKTDELAVTLLMKQAESFAMANSVKQVLMYYFETLK